MGWRARGLGDPSDQRSRPVFAGATCEEVGAEWGRQLDERVVPLIERPFSGVSSKLMDVEILAIQRANKHMRDNGITPTCAVDEFFLSGEAEFSTMFVERIADIFIEYEAEEPPTYDTWRERSIGMVELILSLPDLPYD